MSVVPLSTAAQNDRIIFRNGRESPDYELRVTEDRVTFLPKKNKNKHITR